MPLFFFDIDDGFSHATDTQGVRLEDARQAYGEAKRALLELAAETLPSVGQRCVKCLVRNDQDASVYLLTLVTEEAFGSDAYAGWEGPTVSATDRAH